MNCGQTNLKNWTEFEMKVPWGHISGKWWGSNTVRPILALHGWQDNAGTFDMLIPLLPKHLSFLAIDLPGHGLSSHLPRGTMYHNIDFISIILRIMNEMNWEKICILGHSMGSVIGFWFAGMFPDKVDFIIGIDALKPPQMPQGFFWIEASNCIDKLMLTDDYNRINGEPPAYTYTECVERVHGASKSVNRDKCSYLLARNLKMSAKYPEKFYFSRDIRLKHTSKDLCPQEFYEVLASKIRVPHLLIRALDAPLNDSAKDFHELIVILKSNPFFVYKEVRGQHHVHLNEPETVSYIIGSFLIKYASRLYNQSKL